MEFLGGVVTGVILLGVVILALIRYDDKCCFPGETDE